MSGRGRHYGLDWLRVAAFALLIVYHVAMVFAPWNWVIKSPVTYPALVAPMAALTPWRLPLLFAVSGYASRKLFDRSGGAGAFLRSRSARLLVPLGFAMVALLPPELWVRARLAGYGGGLLHYWMSDYWRPGGAFGFPMWEHLWFVVYLWAYTVVLVTGLAIAGPGAASRLTAGAEWLAQGRRLVWAPLVALVMPKLAMLFVVSEREGLFHDWTAHAEYLPILAFGFALGGSTALWPAIHRGWRWSGAIAALSGTAIVAIELAYQGHHIPPHLIMAVDRSARLATAWSMIVVLLHIADRHWNRDARWRAPLCEAVFPFYLAHHPLLVVLAWAILPLGLGAGAAFALLLAGTAAGCAAFYLIGREIGWLRPLIGLASRRLTAPTGSAGSRARWRRSPAPR